ncbi:MAG: chorismate lyase [Pseudomonadota bacterium]|nr:chorismate lyase [Pseudomonadota bacterium]
MNSFRDIETAAKNINWFKDIKDIANPDDPICKNWLSYTAWMTDKLRNEFPQHTLEVTDESFGEIPPMLKDIKINTLGLRREIKISVVKNVSIFAQTFAPNSTLEKNPWIKDLGNKPLGGKLSLIKDIKRVGLLFSKVKVDNSRVLCRRSSFEFNSEFIHLVEAFPSGLNEIRSK